MYYSLGDENPEFKNSDTFYGISSDGKERCFRVFCNTYKCSCIPNASEAARNQFYLESYAQRDYKLPEAAPENILFPLLREEEKIVSVNEAEERSWKFAEDFLGSEAVNNLRSGGYYDIKANNNKNYRITNDGAVYDLDSRQHICVHPSTDSGSVDYSLPVGDKVAILSQYIMFRPQHLEYITKGVHRRPCRTNEQCWN